MGIAPYDLREPECQSCIILNKVCMDGVMPPAHERLMQAVTVVDRSGKLCGASLAPSGRESRVMVGRCVERRYNTTCRSLHVHAC